MCFLWENKFTHIYIGTKKKLTKACDVRPCCADLITVQSSESPTLAVYNNSRRVEDDLEHRGVVIKKLALVE